MNVNPILVRCLSAIAPVRPDFYKIPDTEKPDKCITFVYEDERAGFCADDEDLCDITAVQVHLFTKSNPQQDKTAIKSALRDEDFAVGATETLYEADTGYHHVVVSAEIEGII